MKGNMKWVPLSQFPGKEGYYWISWTYGPNHSLRSQHIQYIHADGTYPDPTDWDDERVSPISNWGEDAMFYGPLKEPKLPKG